MADKVQFDIVLEDSRPSAEPSLLIVDRILINGVAVLLPEDSTIEIHAEPNDGVRLSLDVFPTSVTIRPGG